MLKHCLAEVNRIGDHDICGTIISMKGLVAECAGIGSFSSIGSRCNIMTKSGKKLHSEVIGFNGDNVLLMPFDTVESIGHGCKVLLDNEQSAVYPCDKWLGRVVNALGKPVDGEGVLPQGDTPYIVMADPPPAHERQMVGGKIDLGVRALNSFLTCCRGQRMGIFSGSGVGKSVMMSMISRFSSADVNVIGLIGERGREVQEFIKDYMGPEGMAKTVMIVATSDESPLMRRQAAYLTLAVAEYFRDEGKEVMCLMDSVTRFAMAMREIGLSVGEPPTTKGYTPKLFSELPRLLERAGPGRGEASITGLFTVLVDGDDHNEPIADAVRGILDGHIVLDRKIAYRGRYPAIDILRSVSRTMPDCNSDKENQLITRARSLLSTYDDMAEMIRLGAYKKGSSKEVDEAIYYNDALEKFLGQGKNERSSFAEGYKQLANILDIEDWADG
jgi:flagellum-specific ATP synthase